MIALSPLLALALSSPTAEAEVIRRALVVGVNDGGGELDPLRYAEDDALKFSGVLSELGGFSSGDVTVLLSPDVAALNAAFADASSALAQADEALFLFYYSGHADAQGLRVGGEVLAYEELKSSIREVPADIHLGILDACRSGAISRIKGASVGSSFLADEALAAEGEAWLTASAEDEDAQESDTLGGSFFTYYLISGLRGAADAGGDGQVSLNEAYAYAYDRTVSRTGGTEAGVQHPTYDFQIQGNGELKLTEVQRATARVTFPEEMTGEITVLRQPDNTPVAEVSKIGGKAITLALEPGRYLLRRRDDGQLNEVTLSLSSGAEHQLTRWGDAVPELGTLKGEEAPPEDALAEVPLTPREELFLELREEVNGVLTEDERAVIQEAVDIARGFDLRESPALAGLASAVFPGAGQAYNGQWVRGALFLGGVLSLSGTGYGLNALGGDPAFTGSPLGPNPATLMGTMLYGWSIADASWQVHPREEPRPEEGVTLSLESAWLQDQLEAPHAAGLAVDWIVHPGISLGIDRSGLVAHPDGTWDASVGGRMMLAGEGERLRPGAFVAAGARFGTGDASGRPVRQVFAGGFNLRWYATPRYFMGYEFRYELDGGIPATTHGGGLGVHFGGGGGP